MPVYNPPLRDMQFVMHEVLNVTADFQGMPQHAEVDAETINAVLEEAGKFAAEVIFPLNISGDTEGCQLDQKTHEGRFDSTLKRGTLSAVSGKLAKHSPTAMTVRTPSAQLGVRGTDFVVSAGE